MCVENSEWGLKGERPEPENVSVPTNQPTGISASRESEAAEGGSPVRAGYDRVAGGIAQQLIIKPAPN